LLAALAATASLAQTDADLIVTGSAVVTMDPDRPMAGAVAVRDGRIVYVGSRDGAIAMRGASTRWIDAGSGVVLPGLVDAHGHLRNLGRSLFTVMLTGTRSRQECVDAVRKAQKDALPGGWIRGRGWDQNDWEVQDFPNWRDLDGTDANPVYLRRVDGHAAWVNAKAMEMAGITRDTPDPPGGRIIRDEGGAPTGVLIDNATDLVARIIPEASDDELDGWMRAAIEHCNRLGLTGVHDAGIDTSMHASLLRLAGRGQLSLRVYGMMSVVEGDDSVEGRIMQGPVEAADGLFVMRAVKLYADGALGSRGAALLEDYSDEPGNRGLMVTTEERIEEIVRLCTRHGFQVCVHAIGDRGNRTVLDVFERVLSASPGDHRFRIEHAQVLSMQDITRFRALGVIPAMQPTHCTSDMYWAHERLGPERVLGAYAWRSLVEDGNIIPMGSDFPVESADPTWGLYAAVTRQDHEGWPESGWYSRQRMTMEEAVRGFTEWAAYASFSEDQAGMLREGFVADITVLDRNILERSPEELLETRPTHTIVAGRVVYGE
jgi:predicted amidohydrolase YtcJ